MEGEEQNENVAHEFDPELALIAQEAKAVEKEQQQEEIVITNEEIIVNNEDNEENEESEGDGKVILRARKKKRNYVNYNANNYKNTNTNYTKNTNTQTKNNNINITTPKKTVLQKKELIYDPDYDYKSNYFYQDMSQNDWNNIKSFLRKAFTGQIPSETQ